MTGHRLMPSMRRMVLEFLWRERFVKHEHYNNGWSIICPIPLQAGTVLRERHTRWDKRRICSCVWEGKKKKSCVGEKRWQKADMRIRLTDLHEWFLFLWEFRKAGLGVSNWKYFTQCIRLESNIKINKWLIFVNF